MTADPAWDNARKAVRQYEAHEHVNKVDHPAFRSPDYAPANISDRKIKGALRRALRERPVPTMLEIARRLGIDPRRIYAQFPGFHKTLQDARLSLLEAAAKAALLESPPPTLRDFKKQRGFSRDMLRRRFPALYRALAVRSAQRRYRRREETESALRAACTEGPPPSGRAVAARTGTNRGHLKKIFPELWRLILQHYAGYQKQQASRKRAAFAERVRCIATDLLMAGKYPSRRRVLALMGNSELRGESLVISEVKRAVFASPCRQEMS